MSNCPQYCGHCFEIFDAAAERCPRCGHSASGLSDRDYPQKLLHTLGHPLADVRLRAVIALGLRGRPEAAPALVACALRHPTDVIQGLEIVASLSRIDAGGPCVAALRCLSEDHPVHAVRAAAASAVAGSS